MKRLVREYRVLLPLFWADTPWIIILTFMSAFVMGVIPPFSMWINSRVLDVGLSVAAKEVTFTEYIPYLSAFVVSALLPVVAGDLLVERYVKPRCRLALHREYKGRMLLKLKKIQYRHLEWKDSREIIDKAYSRAEEAALALFPTAIQKLLSAGLASISILYYLGAIHWWLLPLIVIPFALETIATTRAGKQVNNEMERYWKKERSYTVLGDMLRKRQYIQENYLMGASDYLINTYEKRLEGRNREYEGFYLKHLRKNWKKTCLTRLSQLACSLLLLFCYWKNELSIGQLISLTLTIYTSLFTGNGLEGVAQTVRSMGKYRNAYDYYDRYFTLSEDEYGQESQIPQEPSIEFRDVWFTYPGSEEPVLQGLSFQVRAGEKVSLVGVNGAGKSTVVKLLLGLFEPDRGCVLVGGKPLRGYSQEARSHLFGTVFQDFGRYCISLKENVGIGDVSHMEDPLRIGNAIRQAGLERKVMDLEHQEDTLLGREFEGGTELSGGQWQRIALARAFMGDKPIFILDEPTSQLDPMAESRLYTEFAKLSEGKTALFITHRLGSTKITDRISVLSQGRIIQEGTHEELMKQGGGYAEMFSAQKKWYQNDNTEVENGNL